MARILIVEDELALAQGLRDNFEFDGDEVALAHDGQSGLEMARRWNADIIILDVMMPKLSGLDVCKTLRAEHNTVPIIMLTARGQEIDKVLGLEFGADDYLTKPFGIRELLARVRAILRRCPPGGAAVVPESGAALCAMGALRINFERFIALRDGVEQSLTHLEFKILEYLYTHAGDTVSRNDLLYKVWGYDQYPTTRTVDNYMARLRKKVEPDGDHPRHILTVHGIGYKFIP
jgi:DNA-binding response OmpR family regulator